MVTNPCIRCGKERVVSRVWDETIVTLRGESIITYSDSICPDPVCQKIVDKELRAQQKTRMLRKKERDLNAEKRKLVKKNGKKS